MLEAIFESRAIGELGILLTTLLHQRENSRTRSPWKAAVVIPESHPRFASSYVRRLILFSMRFAALSRALIPIGKPRSALWKVAKFIPYLQYLKAEHVVILRTIRELREACGIRCRVAFKIAINHAG